MADLFDYVIVGSGSAGSVLANRLSADASTTVCVLEAGSSDWHPFIHIPAGFMKTLVDPRFNWCYQAEPSEGTAGRVVQQPRGKTLGGSSSINGHIFNRGQAMDFDVWSQMGNPGWNYAAVLPYFKRFECRHADAHDTYRGRDGEFVVSDLDWPSPLCERFIEGAVSLGIPRNPDYNGASQEGVGYFQRSIHKRRRMSAARAFLRPAMKRQNLAIWTNATATRVLFDGHRATGIEYVKGGDRRQVHARREVLLCGGAINTPALLQLSGMGPATLLGELDVPILAALDGVGENLRDHYAPRVTARVKDAETINERARGLPLVGEVLKYFAGGQSILSLQPTLVHVFWKSDQALDAGDLQITFTPASYKQGVQSQLDEFPGVTVAPWQQRPESTGYVRARSKDPFDPPLIQPNYLQHETDQQVLIKGLKLARRLLCTDALAPYVVAEEQPGEVVQSDDELLDFARQRGTTVFHLMGTCKMGPATDPRAVVDAELRVHGIESLRVVDASIMPTMPSANTNASTLMIAEKAADMIQGREPLDPIAV